ncbi:MAG: type II toxin-antitoxin system MqsA family antitoxin [Acidovorax sp.]|jgi:HTH-type transcriptional regulator/antitoxin MqsA|nr:type II toxin-antitoxin system MqsA family antitoxin [Acidovorax sp.]HQN47655.1 type II toxin-antitoxin system MqsA family antitoxin [Rugosibacter sp.]
MSAQELCPICGEGHVTASVQMVEYEYKGHRAELPSHYKQCDTCTSDFAGMAESKQNKRIVMAFRKQVEGLLTGDEITALRKQYQLTQAQAAKLFGGGPVAFSKYENDDVAQSEAMDTLLRLIRRSPAAFWALVEEKGLQADFTQQREPVRADVQGSVKLVSLTRVQNNTTRSDPRYNPREFRRYSRGEVSCQK